MTSGSIDRLVILIVSGRQAGDLRHNLRQEGFYFTQVDSTGGLLQEPTECLFIGLNNDRLSNLLDLVRRCCKPQKEYIPAQLHVQPASLPLPMIEAQIGGALVCVLTVSRFEQF